MSLSIHEEAKKGNLPVIQSLLSTNPNLLTSKDEDERTALHWASSSGHVDTVLFLLSKKADIDAQDEGGWTPLMCASSAGHDGVVDVLLKSGANVNLVNEGGQTALHYAASKSHTSVIKHLLEHEANATIADKQKQTPLHRAAIKGHIAVVKYLFEYATPSSNKPRVNAQDKLGNTALHLAMEEGKADIALCLINDYGAEMDILNKEEKKPIDLCDKNVKSHVLRALEG